MELASVTWYLTAKYLLFISEWCRCWSCLVRRWCEEIFGQYAINKNVICLSESRQVFLLNINFCFDTGVRLGGTSSFKGTASLWCDRDISYDGNGVT